MILSKALMSLLSHVKNTIEYDSRKNIDSTCLNYNYMSKQNYLHLLLWSKKF